MGWVQRVQAGSRLHEVRLVLGHLCLVVAQRKIRLGCTRTQSTCERPAGGAAQGVSIHVSSYWTHLSGPFL